MSETNEIIRLKGIVSGALASCGETDQEPVGVFAERAAAEYDFTDEQWDVFVEGFADGWVTARKHFETDKLTAPEWRGTDSDSGGDLWDVKFSDELNKLRTLTGLDTEVTSTGGGCLALTGKVEGDPRGRDLYLLATNNGGPHLELTGTRSWAVGFYVVGGGGCIGLGEAMRAEGESSVDTLARAYERAVSALRAPLPTGKQDTHFWSNSEQGLTLERS